MRLGIIADIHGNDTALRAVLDDAAQFGVDRWWALGDLVLSGPHPVEVMGLLLGLPGIEMLRGNTDRYVLTGELFAGCGADIVAGGHTHHATDRRVGGVRALNPGSTGLPRTLGAATWILLTDDGDGVTVTHRKAPFDVDPVIRELRRRRHPNTEFVTGVLTGQREQLRG